MCRSLKLKEEVTHTQELCVGVNVCVPSNEEKVNIYGEFSSIYTKYDIKYSFLIPVLL